MEQTSSLKVAIKDLQFFYGGFQALTDISMDYFANQVTALIGPSGCGKSTLLRCINRMNDLIPHTRVQGQIMYGGQNIYNPSVDVVTLRRHIGMVFQKPNPFPKSVFENIRYGLEVNGIRDKEFIENRVVESLKKAALWAEVEDRLHDNALRLSGGQQQRLCIARCLAIEPDVILFDEPCASLDPTSTRRIEELILQLKQDYTIVIVTHNMQQAARISYFTAFLMLGELIEYDITSKIFTKPSKKITEDYITGRFG